MRKQLAVLSGLSLISITALIGCGQQTHNNRGILMPPSQVKKSNTVAPSQNSTGNQPISNNSTTLTPMQYSSTQKNEIQQAARSTGVKTLYIPQQIDTRDQFEGVQTSGKFIFFTLDFKNVMVNESKMAGFAPGNSSSNEKVTLSNGIHATWYTFPSANGLEHALVFTMGDTYMSIQPTDNHVTLSAAEDVASSLVGLPVDTPTNQVPANNPTGANPKPMSLASQNPGPLTAVSFATDRIGFVASNKGIYRTIDGGQTWEHVYEPPNSSDPILGIQATTDTVHDKQYVYVLAWTKDYMLDSFTGTAFSRVHFDGSAKPGIGNVSIQDVSLGPNGYEFFVSNGVVWSSDGMGAGWLKRTPPVPIAAVANVDDATVYAATTSGAIYKTTDSGNTWTKVFSTSLDQMQEWNVTLKALGNHVAVLYTCSAGAANQRPYVLFESNDSGLTWNTMLDESLFQTSYGKVGTPLNSSAIPIPGPFTMDANGDVFMTGINITSGTTQVLTEVSPAGKTLVLDPIAPSANSPHAFDFPTNPIAISTPDGKHIFVVGGNNGKAVIEASTDSGLTFQSK